MTPEQEKKWREEFEKKWKESNITSQEFNNQILSKRSDGTYYHEFVQHQWNGYLAARKAAQVEIDSLLNQISDYVRRNEDDLKDRDQEIERLKVIEFSSHQIELDRNNLLEELKEREEMIKEAIPLIESKIYTMTNEEWLEKARKMVGVP